MNQQQKDDLKAGDVLAKRNKINGNLEEARVIVIDIRNAPLVQTVVANNPWYPGVHRHVLDLTALPDEYEVVQIPLE